VAREEQWAPSQHRWWDDIAGSGYLEPDREDGIVASVVERHGEAPGKHTSHIVTPGHPRPRGPFSYRTLYTIAGPVQKSVAVVVHNGLKSIQNGIVS